jgi:predicted GIY-YIG superfamily endonuclease
MSKIRDILNDLSVIVDKYFIKQIRNLPKDKLTDIYQVLKQNYMESIKKEISNAKLDAETDLVVTLYSRNMEKKTIAELQKIKLLIESAANKQNHEKRINKSPFMGYSLDLLVDMNIKKKKGFIVNIRLSNIQLVVNKTHRTTMRDVTESRYFKTEETAKEFVEEIRNNKVYNEQIQHDMYDTHSISFDYERFKYLSGNLDVTVHKLVNNKSIRINGAESTRFSIDVGLERVSNGCLEQFIIDGLYNAHLTNSKIPYKQFTREGILETIASLKTEDSLDNTVGDLINFCKYTNIGLTLIYPNKRKFHHVVIADRPHLYGLIADGHISVITNPDIKADINYSKNPTIRPEWNAETKSEIISLYMSTTDLYAMISNSTLDYYIIESEAINLKSLILEIHNKERLIVENIVIDRNGLINSFTYNKLAIVTNYHASDVLKVCKKINEPFANQSIQQITTVVFNKVGFFPPMSKMNSVVYEQFNQIKPVILNEIFEDYEDPFEIDRSKSYTSCLFSTDITHYIYDYYSDIERCQNVNLDFIKANPGHYFVSKMIHKCKIGQQIINSDLLLRFIEIGVVSLVDIYARIIPTKYMPKEHFYNIASKFVTMLAGDTLPISDEQSTMNIINCLLNKQKLEVNENIEESILKNMINKTIGNWGISEGDVRDSFLTTDINVILSMINDNLLSNFEQMGELYIGYGSRRSQKKYTNHLVIRNDILLESTFRVMELEYNIKCSQELTVIGYKTDAIYFKEPITCELPNYYQRYYWGGLKLNRLKDIKTKTQNSKIPIEYTLEIPEWNTTNEIHSSMLLCGTAGTGKSTMLRESIIPIVDNYILLAPTHKACSIFNNLGIKCDTIAHAIGKQEQESKAMWLKRMQKLRGCRVLVDEIGLCSLYDISLLYEIWLNMPIEYIFIGDFKQCRNADCVIDLSDSIMLKQMCNLYKLTLTTVHRYDNALLEKNNQILNEHILTDINYYNSNDLILNNVCYTHKTRKLINDKMMRKAFEARLQKYKHAPLNYYILKTNVDSYPEPTPQEETFIFKGLPVISIITDDTYYNRQSLVVKKVTQRSIYLSNKTKIARSDFNKYFRLGYCQTIHSTQSETIQNKLVIHEMEKFDVSMAYTAISRCTKWENVLIDTHHLVLKFRPVNNNIVMSNVVNSIIGCIYHLVTADGNIFYVGQTKDVGRRLSAHRKTFEAKYPNFKLIKVFDVYSSQNIDELEAEEIAKQSKLNILENKQLVTKAKTRKLTRGVTIPRKQVGGCIYVDERDKSVRFRYSINGVRKEKKFKYTLCGVDEAMKKAKEFQQEVYN